MNSLSEVDELKRHVEFLLSGLKEAHKHACECCSSQKSVEDYCKSVILNYENNLKFSRFKDHMKKILNPTSEDNIEQTK